MPETDRRQAGPANLGELRIKLDQMTERITSRLKDRSRFPQNATIYESNAIEIHGRQDVSFFQFAIEGLEAYHASLGRFRYPDQFPVSGAKLQESSVERKVGESSLQEVNFSVASKLIPFYTGLIVKYCEAGDNPDTYGETAYIDADLVEIMNERINIGRYVAETKGRSDPSVFDVAENEKVLVSKLKDKVREEALIEKVRSTAQRYDLNPDMAEEVFRWMIERTMDVEVAYIQQTSAHLKPHRQSF